MNWKSWLPIGAAVVLGLVAAKVGRDVIAGNNHNAPAPATKTIHVVMAAADINGGTSLKPTDLVVGELPEGSTPGYTFSNVKDLVNRVPTVPLVKGQAILETMLTPQGTPGGLPAIVPSGMRAITLDVNEVTGVAGMLLPGCHVDLVMTMTADSAGPTEARTVIDNLTVIAVGRRFGPPSQNPTATEQDLANARSITLLVTPDQARIVELAGHMGNPRFVLRGSRDNDPSGTEGVTLTELRSGKKQQSGFDRVLAAFFPPAAPASPQKRGAGPTTGPAAPAGPVWTVQVIRIPWRPRSACLSSPRISTLAAQSIRRKARVLESLTSTPIRSPRAAELGSTRSFVEIARLCQATA